VTVEGWSIVNCTLVAAPDAGTLPVPVQPVQTYWTIVAATGEPTEVVMGVPASNQPLAGVGEPYGEVTVNIYW
jgi:hypothetical protein